RILLNTNHTNTPYLALPTKLLSDLNNMSSPAPSFIWRTPNNCYNGHDNNATVTFYGTLSICPLSNNVQEQNSYLKALVPAILNSTTFTTSASLLFITWDEGVACTPTNDPVYPETFPVCIDRVTTIFPGFVSVLLHVSNKAYRLYGFLPTLEE